MKAKITKQDIINAFRGVKNSMKDLKSIVFKAVKDGWTRKELKEIAIACGYSESWAGQVLSEILPSERAKGAGRKPNAEAKALAKTLLKDHDIAEAKALALGAYRALKAMEKKAK